MEQDIDYKKECKIDINCLITFINTLEQDCIDITQQDSDLKVGFLAGKLYSHFLTLKQRLWELEENIDKI